MTGNGSSHQNLSINGMNTGHSTNNGIIHGSSGNIANGGFGTNPSGPTYSSTSKYSINIEIKHLYHLAFNYTKN